MKFFFVTITLLLLIIFNALGQFQAKIKLYAEDLNGNKDSIWLGIVENTTLGIDTLYGEVNIKNKPYNDLDIRIIQRTQDSSNCLYNNIHGWNISFPENIDSKIDFRPFQWPDRSKMTFEINVFARNYPVNISADLEEFNQTLFEGGWSSIWHLDKNCNKIIVEDLPALSRKSLIINDSLVATLVLVMDVHVGIKAENYNSNNFNIYPNPFTDQLTIENKNQQKSKLKQIRIYNTPGQLEYEQTNPNTIYNIIDLSKLKPGIYFLETTDYENRVFRQKIIKN